MHSHPAVRMVEEEVHIKLPDNSVEARFVFHNEGPATSVLIGFPEEGKDVQPRRPSHLDDFRSFVDGKPVKTTYVMQDKPTDDSDYYYKAWWVKRVPFAAGQTRTIVNRYSGGWIYTTYGVFGFTYILKTGSSWKGPIGRARIVCDVHKIRAYAPVHYAPAGYRRVGDSIIWDLRDVKPRDDIKILFFYGFGDVTVNGKSPLSLNEDRMPAWGSDEPLPRRKGNEVWLSTQTAAKWLGADLQIPKRRSIRLVRGARWAEVTLGSSVLHTVDGDAVLPSKAYKMQENGETYTMTPLMPLVKTLGGNAVFNEAGRLVISLKPSATR